MTVQLQGKPRFGLDGAHESRRINRADETGHVLYTEGVRTHLLQRDGLLGESLQGVKRRDCVGKAKLQVCTFLFHLVRGNLHVSEVVQGIENTDDVETVSDGPLDELSNGVVRIMSVPHKILAAEEHLKLRLLKALSEHPQPLPGILVEKAHARVESGAPPHFERVVSNLIHQFRHGKHIFRTQPCGHDGLMSVTQCSLRNALFQRIPNSGSGRCGLSCSLALFSLCLTFSSVVSWNPVLVILQPSSLPTEFPAIRQPTCCFARCQSSSSASSE